MLVQKLRQISLKPIHFRASLLPYLNKRGKADGPCGKKKIPTKIGVIGGSGLDDPDIFENREEKTVTTPYGKPADVLIHGTVSNVPCVLLARHGRKHDKMPTDVPYRANIWALREAGCTHCVVSHACGSLREEIPPGDLVIPHDIIDRTQRRQSFYDGDAKSPKGICHLPMYPAFNERLRKVLVETVRNLNFKVHDKGTVVCIEGPRYSSRAESLMYRLWGGDIINMTIVPEVVLAKEAGLLYCSVATSTDYDCWRANEKSVSAHEVLKTFAANVSKVKQVFTCAVENIAKDDWTEEILKARKLVQDNLIKGP